MVLCESLLPVRSQRGCRLEDGSSSHLVPDATEGFLGESEMLQGLLMWMMSWDGDWELQVPLSRRGLAGVGPAEGTSEDLRNGLPGEPALCQGLPAGTWGAPPASGVQKMISTTAW